MMLELTNYSNYITSLVKDKITYHCEIAGIESQVCTFLCKAFSYYSPNKERGYIVNVIGGTYGAEKDLSSLLEVGLELIFAGYYLKDDLLDDSSNILGLENTTEMTKECSLLADMLVEIGNREIALYCGKIGGDCGALFSGIFSMVYGQLLGLKLGSSIGVNKYFEVAHNKNGVMVESAIRMLRPLIQSETDSQILECFGHSFGVGSQIRNDIEDFLVKEEFGEPLKDLLTNQSNFILSLFYDRCGRESGINKLCPTSLEKTIQEVSEDLILAIKFLDAFKNELLNRLSQLSNLECKHRLEGIVKNTLIIV